MAPVYTPLGCASSNYSGDCTILCHGAGSCAATAINRTGSHGHTLLVCSGPSACSTVVFGCSTPFRCYTTCYTANATCDAMILQPGSRKCCPPAGCNAIMNGIDDSYCFTTADAFVGQYAPSPPPQPSRPPPSLPPPPPPKPRPPSPFVMCVVNASGFTWPAPSTSPELFAQVGYMTTAVAAT